MLIGRELRRAQRKSGLVLPALSYAQMGDWRGCCRRGGSSLRRGSSFSGSSSGSAIRHLGNCCLNGAPHRFNVDVTNIGSVSTCTNCSSLDGLYVVEWWDGTGAPIWNGNPSSGPPTNPLVYYTSIPRVTTTCGGGAFVRHYDFCVLWIWGTSGPGAPTCNIWVRLCGTFGDLQAGNILLSYSSPGGANMECFGGPFTLTPTIDTLCIDAGSTAQALVTPA